MTYEEAKKTIDEFGLDPRGYPSLKKAIDVASKALEKQIPKKLNKTKNHLYPLSCPNCDCGFMDDVDYDCCPSCGQAFLWGNAE